MDHLAIMKKKWGLIPKILSGEKKLESRWYLNRSKPWNTVNTGDMIYFKNSGEPVTARAKVKKVIQYSDLNPMTVKRLLKQYAKDDGLGINKNDLENFYRLFKNKRYALFIYLNKAEPLDKPFLINKTGFGVMSAWISVNNINDIVRE